MSCACICVGVRREQPPGVSCNATCFPQARPTISVLWHHMHEVCNAIHLPQRTFCSVTCIMSVGTYAYHRTEVVSHIRVYHCNLHQHMQTANFWGCKDNIVVECTVCVLKSPTMSLKLHCLFLLTWLQCIRCIDTQTRAQKLSLLVLPFPLTPLLSPLLSIIFCFIGKNLKSTYYVMD